MKSFRSAISSVLLCHICGTLAGLQAPITVINMSPWDVVVDMDAGDDYCIYTNFYPDTIKSYFGAYANDDLTADNGNDYYALNQYLQAYKTRYDIPDLSVGLSSNNGQTTLPALVTNGTTYFSVHPIEMKSSGGCDDHHSSKQFSVTVNGTETLFELYDPPTSNWEMHMMDPWINVDIGPGGHADLSTVLFDAIIGIASAVAIATGVAAVAAGIGILTTEGIAAEVLVPLGRTFVARGGLSIAMGGGGAYEIWDHSSVSEQAGEPSISTLDSTQLFGFSDVYTTISGDKKGACLIGENVMGNYRCMAASTSLVIQADGTAVAVPLPAVSRAW